MRRNIVLFLCMVALVWLTACSGSQTGTSVQPTPTTFTFPGTASGCPDEAGAPKTLPPANVIVHLSDANTTLPARVGDVIEIRLPFGLRWTGPTSSQGGLELQPPAGFAWKADRVCLWRFIARKQGTTKLLFSERALCRPDEPCPMYILALSFLIQVKEQGAT